MSKLTEKKYWDAKYGGSTIVPLSLDGFANHSNACVYETLKLANLQGKKVLEIGAGGSQWITFLARQFPSSSFAGLDYSEVGCEELKRRAELEKVDIDIECADLYNPPDRFKNAFDIVITYGVVEHFDNLDEILPALLSYLKTDGKLYTIIPNMAGVIGKLTKRFNRCVYDIHNPHNLESLVEGHQRAGLNINHADYVCSTEFGVLSSCINDGTGKTLRLICLWLSRITKVISILERKFGNFPATPYLSAYIYCIAARAD